MKTSSTQQLASSQAVNNSKDGEEAFKKYTSMVVECSEEFIDLFSDACNSSMKSEISEAIHHQRIHKVLKQVDVNDQLTVESAHRIFKRCYGWRTWIHAPEEGVRGMIRESITLYYAPLKLILDDVDGITREACAMAFEECTMLNTPANEGLKQLMEQQAYESIDEWKMTTWEQLARNLHAEVEFPAPERFRALRSSIDRLLEQEAMMQAERLVQHYQNMIQISMKSLSLRQSDIVAMRRDEIGSHAILTSHNIAQTEDVVVPHAEFYMGWLEKKNRFGRWQRRWFVISAEKKRLWYFSHPEEQPARGAASLVGCSIFPDVMDDDSGQLAFRLVFRAADQQYQNWFDGFAGKTKSAIVSLTLRATSKNSKLEWMDMIGRAILGQSIKSAPRVNGNTIDITAESNTQEAERKISTQVFDDEEEETETEKEQHQTERKRPTRTRTLRSHGVSFAAVNESNNDSDDETTFVDARDDGTDEERLAKEISLFEEISEQAAAAVPSNEEAIMLECVTKAVREYMIDSQKSITEQASKIIADGMLPMLHKENLHANLLKVLNASASSQ
jgi:hypothetical protein